MFPGWNPVQQTYYQPQFQMVPMQPVSFGWPNPGMAPQPPMPDMMGGVSAASQEKPPPPDDKPPLPPDPPPSEDTKPKEDELKPKDPIEEQKLAMLKNQAAVWQQSQQMQQQAMWSQWPAPGAPPMPFQPPVFNPMDAILKEEQEFNVQYDQWKQQYTDWREQNKSHPNKEQFQQYLQQWQMYEKQMEEKKADIARRKEMAEQQMKQMQQAPPPQQMPMMPGQPGFVPPPGPVFDAPRAEGPRFEGPRPGVPGFDCPRPDAPRFEGPRPDAPRFEGPRPDAPRFDAPRPDAPRFDGPRPDAPRFVGPRPDAPRFVGPRPDAPRFDGPRPDAPGFRGPRPDAQRFSGPRFEGQRFDGPGPSGPRFDGPRGSGSDNIRPQFGRGRGGNFRPEFDPGFQGPGGLGDQSKAEDDHSQEDMVLDVLESDDDNLVDNVLNKDNVGVNKMMLNQLSEESRELINHIGREGKIVIAAFGKMNPAQLNKMVRLINDFGDEIKVSKRTGRPVRPDLREKMKTDLMEEMRSLGLNIPGEFGNDQGMGRGQRFDTPRGPRPLLSGPFEGQRGPRPLTEGFQGQNFGPRGQRFGGPRFGGPDHDGSKFGRPDSDTKFGDEEETKETPESHEEDSEKMNQSFGMGNRGFNPVPRFDAPAEGGSQFKGPRFGIDNTRGPRPGMDNMRGPRPDMGNIRGLRPGMDNVRGPRPLIESPSGPRMGMNDIRGHRPLMDNMRGPSAGMDNIRGPRPGIDSAGGSGPRFPGPGGGGPVPLMSLSFSQPPPAAEQAGKFGPKGVGADGQKQPGAFQGEVFESPQEEKKPPTPALSTPGSFSSPHTATSQAKMSTATTTTGSTFGDKGKFEKQSAPASKTQDVSKDKKMEDKKDDKTDIRSRGSTPVSSAPETGKKTAMASADTTPTSTVTTSVTASKPNYMKQGQFSLAGQNDRNNQPQNNRNFQQQNNERNFQHQNNQRNFQQGNFQQGNFQNQNMNKNAQQQSNERNFQNQNNNRIFQQQHNEINFQNQNNNRNFQRLTDDRQNEGRNFQQENNRSLQQRINFQDDRNFQAGKEQFDRLNEQEQQEGYEEGYNQYGEEGYGQEGYGEENYSQEGYGEEGYGHEDYGEESHSQEDYSQGYEEMGEGYGQETGGQLAESQQYERDRQQRDQWGQSKFLGPEKDRDRSTDRGDIWGNREEPFDRRRPPFGDRGVYGDEAGYREEGRKDRPYGAPDDYKRPPPPLLERRPPDRVDPFGARPDPYDRYPDPYRDPMYDRRDPYDRSFDDRFRDPYRRPPVEDPYRRDYGDRYDPYRAAPPPGSGFKPVETIDYGHKGSAALGREEGPRPFQAPAVIDYGHGQTVDDRPRAQDRPMEQPMGFNPRSLESRDQPGFSARPLESRGDDRRGGIWDRQAPPPVDRGFPSPFMEREGFGRQRVPPGPPPGPPPGHPGHAPEKKTETMKVEDLLVQPGRTSRPQQIVVVVRGLPGSGKTYVSKLIKDKEVSNGGSAPRMLCLDDYFMIEVDRIEKDPETGKRVKKKTLEYEYEAEMESAYRQNMLKSFKKTIDDGFFPFIIVDAVFDRVKHFEEFWSYAKSKGFQVYVVEMQAEVSICAKRNTHKRSQREIEKLKNKWEETPAHYIRLDIRSLLQEDSITEVEMEDLDTEPPSKSTEPKGEEEEEEDGGHFIKKSKWELDITEGTLDKLDGLQHRPKHVTQSMEEYLQLADEYFAKQIQDPGKKRVRWADLEERKEQSYRRELGFVVGQTQRDWERITDDTYADRQLNRTKYF